MTTALVSLTDIKNYLGKTGTDDDLLIASIASNATAMLERDTGRIFAVASNVRHEYSSDGQALITVHDRPKSDATRVVTFNGATLTEGTNYWLLPDRRNPDVSVQLQIRPFDTSVAGWYKVDPQWWDKNLDNPRYAIRSGMPLDIAITGTVGHPVTPGDVTLGLLELAAFLYWRAKGGASSYAETMTGVEVDLALLPQAYQTVVRNWKIHTAVVAT